MGELQAYKIGCAVRGIGTPVGDVYRFIISARSILHLCQNRPKGGVLVIPDRISSDIWIVNPSPEWDCDYVTEYTPGIYANCKWCKGRGCPGCDEGMRNSQVVNFHLASAFIYLEDHDRTECVIGQKIWEFAYGHDEYGFNHGGLSEEIVRNFWSVFENGPHGKWAKRRLL